MAHVQGIKRQALAPMVAHYERTPELERGYTRSNIDPERTPLNYNLRPRNVAEGVALAVEQHERVSGRKVRSDANLLFDWVVTQPQDVRPGDSQAFFEAVAAFMDDTYGSRVMGFYVHMDETTPHAHVPIVPVLDGRINGKKLMSRNHLLRFHGELGKAVDESLGYHVSIELGDDRCLDRALSRSAESLEEFKKAKDAAKRQVDAALAKQRAEADSLLKVVQVCQDAKQRAEAQAEDALARFEQDVAAAQSLEEDIGALEAEKKDLRDQVASAKREAWQADRRLEGLLRKEARARVEVEELEAIVGLVDEFDRAKGRERRSVLAKLASRLDGAVARVSAAVRRAVDAVRTTAESRVFLPAARRPAPAVVLGGEKPRPSTPAAPSSFREDSRTYSAAARSRSYGRGEPGERGRSR